MRDSNDDDDDDYDSWYEYKGTVAMKNRWKDVLMMSSLIGQIRTEFLSDKIKIEFENWALLSHYAASSGNLLPMFRDNLSFPFSVLEKPKK
jgi:hypothetical protein